MRISILGLAVALVACSPTRSPSSTPDGGIVEAGAGAANGICSLIEGITDNQTVISICATVDEIAQIVAFVSTFLKADGGSDGGTCEVLPTTTTCLSRVEVGRGITYILHKRQSRLLRDAGLQ